MSLYPSLIDQQIENHSSRTNLAVFFLLFLPDLLAIIVYSKIPVQLFLPSFGNPFVYTSASQIHRLNHAGFNLAASPIRSTPSSIFIVHWHIYASLHCIAWLSLNVEKNRKLKRKSQEMGKVLRFILSVNC